MGRADLAALVRICDPAGRPYGTGFVADDLGTVVTGHDVVRGRARPLLRPMTGDGPAVPAETVVPLPERGLALVRAAGLALPPLPIGARAQVEPGTYVRLVACGWREARVLAAGPGLLELAIGTDGSDALRLAGAAAGGPVLDAGTGAVLAVLAEVPPAGAPAAALARPLRPAFCETHDGLLRRNAASAPAYGQDLNLAAVLVLTAASLGRADAPGGRPEPVLRPDVVRELAAFTGPRGRASVLALAGAPGTGRTTELRGLAARRLSGPEPAPTLWLRGADLHAGDRSVADAVARALRGAARALGVPERGAGADRAARLALDAGRPLLVVVDGPEERPATGAREAEAWTAATTEWLARTGTRMALACRPEYWDEAGALFPQAVLHCPTGTSPRASAPAGRSPAPMALWAPASAGAGVPADAFVGGQAPPVRGRTAWDGASVESVVPSRPEPMSVAGPERRVVAPVARIAPVGARAPLAPEHPVPLPPQRPAEPPPATDRAPDAAVATHRAPDAAAVTYGAREATVVRHRVPDTVVATHVAPDTVVATHVAPDIAVALCRPPHRPGPAPGRCGADSGTAAADPRTPPAVHIGDLTPEEARQARRLYGLEPGALAAHHERHPLLMRLLAEVRRALPGTVPHAAVRDEVFSAHLDLLCLRTALRVSAPAGSASDASPHGPLAASAASRVHQAARHCLGTGGGSLDRAAFESLFPEAGGWASAVLAEGLFVRTGSVYRFAHDELADWLQGAHLDLDAVLCVLVHRRQGQAHAACAAAHGRCVAGEQSAAERHAMGGVAYGHVPPYPPPTEPYGHPAGEDDASPVPRHRVGTVVEALLARGRKHGAARLGRTLDELVDTLRHPGTDRRAADVRWWASTLIHQVLLRVPDAEPFLPVLRRLTRTPDATGRFGPGFWAGLSLGDPARLDLLRQLVPSDPFPPGAATPRYLKLADERLIADPRAVQPLLCRWFHDETPLTPGRGAGLRPTVAATAQALLHARRTLATDDLAEALAGTDHPRAAELLRALSTDAPSVMCRAVERWARDPRPERRARAAAHAAAVAAAATAEADRRLLRNAATALLRRPEDTAFHGTALAVLVRDPAGRPRHLAQALELFVAKNAGLPADAFTGALATHPGPVLAALRARLLTSTSGTAEAPAEAPADAPEILALLAGATDTATARRAAALVCEYVDHCPAGAVHAAEYVRRRIEGGADAGDVLFPLVTHLVRGRPARVRSALAPVLAAPGGPPSRRSLRAGLLEVLLRYEQYEARDVTVLDALLGAVARGSAARAEEETRALVQRTGALLVRTSGGAERFERRLVELAGEVPHFAGVMARRPARDPHEWAVLVGPDAREAVLTAGRAVPMPTGEAEHGSLRPA